MIILILMFCLSTLAVVVDGVSQAEVFYFESEPQAPVLKKSLFEVAESGDPTSGTDVSYLESLLDKIVGGEDSE